MKILPAVGLLNSILAFTGISLFGDGSITGNFIATVGTIALSTLGFARWIDSRIDHKLREHLHLNRAILKEVCGLREHLGLPPIDVEEVLQPFSEKP